MIVNVSLRRLLQKFSGLSSCRTLSSTGLLYVPDVVQYNIEEQQKILKILNECTHEELARFKISAMRLARISSHREKFGPFHDLNDVCKASGMTPRSLDRLCTSILQPSSEKPHGIRPQLIKPNLTNTVRDNIQNVIGINLLPYIVTWAKIDRQGTLLEWNSEQLDLGPKKQHPLNLLEIAAEISCKLGKSDAYVMEEMGTPSQLSKNLLNALQTVQLRAMILALLNAAHLHPSADNFLHEQQQKVFFLKSHLPARFFQTLVGSERISAQSAVEEIIQKKGNVEKLWYTPVTVDPPLRNAYYKRNSAEKEMMCHSLLLTMTFLDIAVHLNEKSLSALSARKLSNQ